MRIRYISAFCLVLTYGNSPFFPCYAKALSAEAATRAFYSWYAPKALAPRDQPAWAEALKEKPTAVSARLRKLLQADLNRKALSRGVVVGIDFEPFFGSQDVCANFTIKTLNSRENSYLVEVSPICDREVHQPPVIVLLIQSKDGLVIDDVEYRDFGTLRALLRIR